MSRLAALRAMPGSAQVPVSFVLDAIDEHERERVRVAADREETIQMWEEIATRHLSEDPWRTPVYNSSEASPRSPGPVTGAPGHTPLDGEA